MNDNKLIAKATAGVYAEVMKQIYDSVDKRFREAVSNAYDANATKISISVYIGPDDQIIFADDGEGMNREDLQNNYINMGGGGKYEDEKSIGRIGIGALSIFALGDSITVRTRKKGTDKVLTAKLDFSKLKEAREHAKPLDQVSVGEIRSIRDSNEDDKEHFTEITIRSLSKACRDIFINESRTRELIDRLERILPVPFHNDDEIFRRLTPDIGELLRNEKYNIEVEFHCPSLDYEHYTIKRRSILTVDNTRISRFYPITPYFIKGGSSTQLNVYGYMYINADKKLPEEWQGINIRVKNVTIESGTFFGYEKDSAAKVRIGGELFIRNIDENNAIQSNRSGFARENPDYLLISQFMTDRIMEATRIVRQNSEIDSKVKKAIKKIDTISKIFKNSAAVENTKGDAENFKALEDPNVFLPQEMVLFDLEQRIEEILDDEDVTFDFLWSSVIEDLYLIEYSDDDFYTIYVHDDLRTFKHDVSGNSVEYIICFCGKEIPFITKKPGRVIVNLDNAIVKNNDILKLEPGFLKVVLALYMNYLRCNGDATKLYSDSINDLVQ